MLSRFPFGFGHLIGTFFIPSETSWLETLCWRPMPGLGRRHLPEIHLSVMWPGVPQCASHCNSVQHTASVTLHLSVMWPGLPGSEVLPPFSVCTIGLPASQTRCCCSSKDQTRITALVFTFDPQPVSLRTPVIIST